MKKIFKFLLSIPNTIRFNFHYFPFKIAIKLPVLVSKDVRLVCLGKKGSIVVNSKRFNVRLGFHNGSFDMGYCKKSFFSHESDSKILFGDNISLANNFMLTVHKGSNLIFGDNFCSNSNFIISVENEVKFGKNVMIGWDCKVIDADGHKIIYNGNVMNSASKIIVGNNCWFASNCTILKGCSIPSNCVISTSSLVNKSFYDENVLIGGIPEKNFKKRY